MVFPLDKIKASEVVEDVERWLKEGNFTRSDELADELGREVTYSGEFTMYFSHADSCTCDLCLSGFFEA